MIKFYDYICWVIRKCIYMLFSILLVFLKDWLCDVDQLYVFFRLEKMYLYDYDDIFVYIFITNI